jgi:hypothetical protein
MADTNQMVVPRGDRLTSILMADGRKVFSKTKPAFSFQYEELRFTGEHPEYYKDGIIYALNPAQIQEVNDFLNNLQPDEELGRQVMANIDARRFLATTDWYVVRFAETGIPIPEDIRIARQEARDKIVHVE